ncbi:MULTISPECIES: DUF2269 domain-containing protein [Rhodomicrobium]|uniref:DUF2269 family protein n=1 Tax=Rhodomicrobium TaxID=1068 RepID=UPI000B4B64E7|nr:MULTISPECIES: DUF2269 domain-containing protein [Rhodomicrobium]
MNLYFALKYLHILGAAVLLGTGAGIAFFMLMAHRTGNVALIAGVARIVVIADFLFTATAAVLQPATGLALASVTGYALTEGWIMLSIGLYIFVGIFWLPVVRMQMQMRRLADAAAAAGTPLPERYHRLFRTWFAFGFPAFAAMLAIYWLMMTRPSLAIY